MELLPALILFAVGILLIIQGGDLFVDAAAWIAAASGIPQFIIGATVVSLATTLPEIIVSCFAAYGGQTEMAIGNAIGSVTANTGLILAVSVLFLPVAIRWRHFAVKSLIMVLSTLFLWVLCRDGTLSPVESLVMVLLFAAFLAENISSAAEPGGRAANRVPILPRVLWKQIGLFALGAVMLVAGSRLLVNNGEILAVALGVPERIIAITLVAIGTSLPELVTAITAITKKQTALSVGNILGANIIDITIILPLCVLLSGGPLPVSLPTVRLDMPFCLLETLIAVVPTLLRKRFSRAQGVAMLAVYGVYLLLSLT